MALNWGEKIETWAPSWENQRKNKLWWTNEKSFGGNSKKLNQNFSQKYIYFLFFFVIGLLCAKTNGFYHKYQVPDQTRKFLGAKRRNQNKEFLAANQDKQNKGNLAGFERNVIKKGFLIFLCSFLGLLTAGLTPGPSSAMHAAVVSRNIQQQRVKNGIKYYLVGHCDKLSLSLS